MGKGGFRSKLCIRRTHTGRTLGVTPVAVPDDADILSEDSSQEDDWSDDPATIQERHRHLWADPSDRHHNPDSGIARGNTNPESHPVEEEHATVLVICSHEKQRTVRQMRKKLQSKVDSGDDVEPRPGERPTRSKSLGGKPDFEAFRAKVKREQQ